MPRLRQLLICCLIGAVAGCTHVQLRNNSVNEASAVADMERQQVLNNLAMFVSDFNATPYFSFPNQTTAIVTDQGSAGLTPSWGRPISSGFSSTAVRQPPHFGDFLLASLGLSVTGSRQAQESFVITPINDPRKLELMRCAYQLAVSRCGFGPVPRSCPDCQARFNTFYTGDPEGDIRQLNGGAITSECLKGPCWFVVGCKKSVPKECNCGYVGQYCDTYVWVPPEGRDELTKLTLAILDYALHEPPVRLTKQVVYQIDELGLPTTKNDSVGTVQAVVGINEHPESLLNIPPADAVRIEQILRGRHKNLLDRYQAAKEPEEKKQLLAAMAVIEQKLDFLQEQLRAGGLKEQFYPGAVNPGAPIFGLPQLQQQFQTITPPPISSP